MAFRLPDICESAIQKYCPDCGGKPGDHTRGRCDPCHIVARDARWARQAHQLADPKWWINAALRDIDTCWPEDARDALVEACRLLSKQIHREAGR